MLKEVLSLLLHVPNLLRKILKFFEIVPSTLSEITVFLLTLVVFILLCSLFIYATMGPKKIGSQKDPVKGKSKQVDLSSESEEEKDMDQLEKTLKKLFTDFKKEIKKDMREFQDSLSYNNAMLEDALKKIEDMTEAQKKMGEENIELKNKVKLLESSIDDLEQYTRNKNVQIDGIPPKQDENLRDIVMNIGNKIQVDIKREDIDAIHRIPTRSTKTPEPIVVQFLTRQMRESVVQKAREVKVHTKDLGFNEESKQIYVNEHLTRKKKHILFEARRLKYEKNYKYLWTKSGKIFIRKEDRSPIINLNSIDDLHKIM